MATSKDRAVWAFVVVSLAVLVGVVLRLQQLPTSIPDDQVLPVWALALATFAVQSMPIHIATDGGRHSVTLTEVVLAIGLFTAEPDLLVVGVTLGAIPAAARLRPTPVKAAVNTVMAGLWVAIPALVFHHFVSVVVVEPDVVVFAFSACVLAYVGGVLTVRIPIGLVSGQWRFGEGELRDQLVTSVTGLGAAALALIGLVLADRAPVLLALLVLPIVQVVVATRQQARRVDRRVAMDFTVDASRQLRASDDVAGLLSDLLPAMQVAFGARHVIVLLSTDLGESRCSKTASEPVSCPSVVPGEVALRAWLDMAPPEPTTIRDDDTLSDLAAALEVRELLVAPLVLDRGVGAIVLAGRKLGPFTDDHVELLHTCAASAASAIERQIVSADINELQTRGLELERRASHDPLTSLANRSVFERELAATIGAGIPCAVLFIDLDDFKAVNDTHGHGVGDIVLVAAARRIAKRVRRGDVAARIGGDEFAVLVRERGLEEAEQIGRRILRDFATNVRGAPVGVHPRAAIGIAAAQPGDGPSDLVSRADQAMYEAKAGGGHRVQRA